jgi:hypothetical protein
MKKMIFICLIVVLFCSVVCYADIVKRTTIFLGADQLNQKPSFSQGATEVEQTMVTPMYGMVIEIPLTETAELVGNYFTGTITGKQEQDGQPDMDIAGTAFRYGLGIKFEI